MLEKFISIIKSDPLLGLMLIVMIPTLGYIFGRFSSIQFFKRPSLNSSDDSKAQGIPTFKTGILCGLLSIVGFLSSLNFSTRAILLDAVIITGLLFLLGTPRFWRFATGVILVFVCAILTFGGCSLGLDQVLRGI